MKDLDSELMLRAIELGAGGDPTPNPHVGSVLAKADGTIIAEGFHEAAGLDHAEVVALKKAGPKSKIECNRRQTPLRQREKERQNPHDLS